MKHKLYGLSLKRDKHFVRNLIIVIGVVLVWRGTWHLADVYLFPQNQVLSSIVSILIGIVILYLPDGTLEHLGGSKDREEPILNHATRDILIILTILIILVGIIVSYSSLGR